MYTFINWWFRLFICLTVNWTSKRHCSFLSWVPVIALTQSWVFNLLKSKIAKEIKLITRKHSLQTHWSKSKRSRFTFLMDMLKIQQIIFSKMWTLIPVYTLWSAVCLCSFYSNLCIVLIYLKSLIYDVLGTDIL